MNSLTLVSSKVPGENERNVGSERKSSEKKEMRTCGK